MQKKRQYKTGEKVYIDGAIRTVTMVKEKTNGMFYYLDGGINIGFSSGCLRPVPRFKKGDTVLYDGDKKVITGIKLDGYYQVHFYECDQVANHWYNEKALTLAIAEFKKGDKVEVSDNGKVWTDAKFIGEVDHEFRYIVQTDLFISGQEGPIGFKYCRHPEPRLKKAEILVKLYCILELSTGKVIASAHDKEKIKAFLPASGHIIVPFTGTYPI